MMQSGLSFNAARASTAASSSTQAGRGNRFVAGSKESECEIELQKMLDDHQHTFSHLATNDTRENNLKTRQLNKLEGDVKVLANRCKATRNKGLYDNAIELLDTFVKFSKLVRAAREYGIELKTPRRGKQEDKRRAVHNLVARRRPQDITR